MVNFAQKLGQLAKNRDYTHLPPHRPILKPHVWFSSSIRGRIKGEYAYRIARGATFPAAGASFSGSVVSKVVRQIPSAKGFLFQLRLSEFTGKWPESQLGLVPIGRAWEIEARQRQSFPA